MSLTEPSKLQVKFVLNGQTKDIPTSLHAFFGEWSSTTGDGQRLVMCAVAQQTCSFLHRDYGIYYLRDKSRDVVQ